MLDHDCDECGSKVIDVCLCVKCRDERDDRAFQDGKAEGYDEGYNKAKEELTNDN